MGVSAPVWINVPESDHNIGLRNTVMREGSRLLLGVGTHPTGNL